VNINNYKTVKCKNFDMSGQCKYGNSCTFAHGDHEVKKTPDYNNNMQGSGSKQWSNYNSYSPSNAQHNYMEQPVVTTLLL